MVIERLFLFGHVCMYNLLEASTIGEFVVLKVLIIPNQIGFYYFENVSYVCKSFYLQKEPSSVAIVQPAVTHVSPASCDPRESTQL